MIKGTIASPIRIPPFLELYTRLYEERIERFHVFGKKTTCLSIQHGLIEKTLT